MEWRARRKKKPSVQWNKDEIYCIVTVVQQFVVEGKENTLCHFIEWIQGEMNQSIAYVFMGSGNLLTVFEFILNLMFVFTMDNEQKEHYVISQYTIKSNSWNCYANACGLDKNEHPIRSAVKW